MPFDTQDMPSIYCLNGNPLPAVSNHASSSKPETSLRGRITVILPRGEAIRNFVYTDTLRELRSQCEVQLLSVFPSVEIRLLLEGLFERVFQLERTKEKWVVSTIREWLNVAHDQFLCSEASQDRRGRRKHVAKKLFSHLKHRVKEMACSPFANPLGLEFLSKLECISSNRFQSSNKYIEMFAQLKPVLVFNTSHVHSQVALHALHSAQALGIPTATFIFSWDNLTSQSRIVPTYDYYLVWNELMRDQLLQIYGSIRPEQIFVTGSPQFDFHFREEFYWSREEFCSRVGADPCRPIVLYSTSMDYHTPGEPKIVQGIADIIREMPKSRRPQLLVRVYPKDLTGRFERLRSERTDILMPEIPWEPSWLTPKMEDAYLLTNMLRHASVGVNVASTVSLELCMFDKPVINVGYNPPDLDNGPISYARYYKYDHYRPVTESGAVQVAYSEDQLRQMLEECLCDPTRHSEQRRALVSKVFGSTLDGRSSKRVSDTLQMIMSQLRGQ